MKNIVVILSVGFLGLILVLVGCEGGGRAGAKKSVSASATPGEAVFKKYCVTCHGTKGNMGLNGAADLTISTLTTEETVEIITNGRKMMAPYKSILSAQEISQVTEHVLTLRQ